MNQLPCRMLLVSLTCLGLVLTSGWLRAAEPFFSGEGVVDISPPQGTALGGFHYANPEQPRVTTGIHYPPEVRCLALRLGPTRVFLISFDMLNVSFAMVADVQRRIAEAQQVPADHVHICATHAHSMPSIAFNRHWGANNPSYEQTVSDAMVRAAEMSQQDLAHTELYAGSDRAEGANVNRTVREGTRSDLEFDSKANEQDRWLDAGVHVLHFERGAGKRNLLWYQFSAHPITYGGSGLAGPGWPGVVQRLLRSQHGISASYLQGHIGDVNPVARDRTATLVTDAILRALASARHVDVKTLRSVSKRVELPFNLQKFRDEVQRQLAVPDSGSMRLFYADWYETFASRYDLARTSLPITLSAVQVGDVGMVFHPAELYSYYGLAIQRVSPFRPTLVVGYADGYVGYVPDVRAYVRREYAADMVPRILNYPPFQDHVGTVLTDAADELLRTLVGEPRR